MNPRALAITAPHVLELVPIKTSEPLEHEVLVEVAHSCISPGTESRVLAGTQQGMPALPVVPGYSASGIIIQTGAGSSWKIGDRVFFQGAACQSLAVCWGAHQSHVLVADEKLVAIPENVSLAHASCAKLAAIAEHGRRLADITAEDRVAVLGLGPIGFFAAICARAAGAEVSVWDLHESRRAKAVELGLTLLAEDAVGNAGRFSVVVDATGAAPALLQAIALLRDKPWDDSEHLRTRLLLQGSYARPPQLPYDELFLKEPSVLIPRDNQTRDIRRVLSLMAENLLPVGAILHDFGSPENAGQAHAMLSSGDVITGYFSWHV